ncbi:glycosyltransferase family 15 protein [Sphaerobolus stellatus SS14]|nr:glycosyltransferase family 15 protein [Sphaerobolus stellatus SS14]
MLPTIPEVWTDLFKLAHWLALGRFSISADSRYAEDAKSDVPTKFLQRYTNLDVAGSEFNLWYTHTTFYDRDVGFIDNLPMLRYCNAAIPERTFLKKFVELIPHVEPLDLIMVGPHNAPKNKPTINEPYDPVALMRDRAAVYGFLQTNEDAVFVQPSLASNVSQFLSKHRAIVPPGANMKFQRKEPKRALAGNWKSEGWSSFMYNNWEISHHSAGGFFYERWGDGLVHSYYAVMAFRPEQVMQFTDIGNMTTWGMSARCWIGACAAVIMIRKVEGFNNRGDELYNAKSRTSWPY